MEAPGTWETPPIITRPGSPHACMSTAAIRFDRCISYLRYRLEECGAVIAWPGHPEPCSQLYDRITVEVSHGVNKNVLGPAVCPAPAAGLPMRWHLSFLFS